MRVAITITVANDAERHRHLRRTRLALTMAGTDTRSWVAPSTYDFGETERLPIGLSIKTSLNCLFRWRPRARPPAYLGKAWFVDDSRTWTNIRSPPREVRGGMARSGYVADRSNGAHRWLRVRAGRPRMDQAQVFCMAGQQSVALNAVGCLSQRTRASATASNERRGSMSLPKLSLSELNQLPRISSWRRCHVSRIWFSTAFNVVGAAPGYVCRNHSNIC